MNGREGEEDKQILYLYLLFLFYFISIPTSFSLSPFLSLFILFSVLLSLFSSLSLSLLLSLSLFLPSPLWLSFSFSLSLSLSVCRPPSLYFPFFLPIKTPLSSLCNCFTVCSHCFSFFSLKICRTLPHFPKLLYTVPLQVSYVLSSYLLSL